MDLVVRRYEPKDYTQIYGWYEKRSLESIPPNFLPEIGFIVDGVGAGFLYKTDSLVCIIDSAITNPDSDKEIRKNMILKLADRLVKEADNLGFKYVFTNTSFESLKDMWISLDFKIRDNNHYLYRGL
jgi:hypothetical protein